MKKQLSENHLKVPKRLCITRWSLHADATDALMNGYLIFKELIKQFIENKDCYLYAISLIEAKWLFNKFNNLESLYLL